MLKTITTVAIALLSIASTASAQNNFTFANRTVLTPGTEQAPFVMTPRLPYQPVADTSSITCDLHLFGTSAPPSNYVYNAWYSYTPQVAGYIGVINSQFYIDMAYNGSSLSTLGNPTVETQTDAIVNGTKYSSQFYQGQPGTEFILRHCAYSDTPLTAAQIDSYAQPLYISFIPSLAADLGLTATSYGPQYSFESSDHFYFSVTNNGPAPSSDFTINFNVQSQIKLKAVNISLPGGATAVGNLDPTATSGTYSARIPKAGWVSAPNGTPELFAQVELVPIITERTGFSATVTASITNMVNPDPNLANNTTVSQFVPPPPTGGGGNGGAAAVPTAQEWQLLAFGAFIFLAAAGYHARRSKQA